MCKHKWSLFEVLGESWEYYRCPYCEDAKLISLSLDVALPLNIAWLRDSTVRIRDIEWMTRTPPEWAHFRKVMATKGTRYIVKAISTWFRNKD